MGEVLEREMDIRLYRELGRPETLSLLDRFYADQRRWAFTLQVHFINERFRMIKQIHDAGGGVLDRSIYGDRIFATVLHEDGQMTDEEYVTYSTLLANMLEHVQPPRLLIYLDCTVETAMARIRKRDRGLESGIPRDYLERLNQRYLQFFDDYDVSPKIRVDTDARPIDVAANLPPLLDEIRAAVAES